MFENFRFAQLCQIREEMAAEEGQVIGCHANDVWAVQLDTAKQTNKLVSCNSVLFDFGIYVFVFYFISFVRLVD